MNQTILSGNLTADIESRQVGEQQLSKFTLACNEGDRVIFMPVEAWNMPHLEQYLAKGSKVLVSGGLKQDSWETEGGAKRSRIVLTAHRVEFLDQAPHGQGQSQSGPPSTRKRGPSNLARPKRRSVA